MATITFYRQARRDGGVRTGIDVDGETVLDRFDEATGEPDPAIVWYVDVRCEGPRLPRTTEAARRWLIRQEGFVTRAMNKLADELPAGIDPDDWPLRKTLRPAGGDAKMTIACSAVRRVEAQQIAEVLRDVAANWRKRLETLQERQPA